MEFEIQTSQVVGLSDERRWSQTQAVDNIIVALELVSDGTFSAKVEGDKFLISLINLLKLRNPQDKEVFRLLISQFIDSSLLRNQLVSLMVGMYIGSQIYLFCKGNASALIKRGSLWSEIISADGFVSGTIQDQDIVIFETETFRKLLPYEIVMEKFIQEDNLQLAGEKLGTLLHNFDKSQGAAAVFAFFKTTPSEEKTESLTKEERTSTIIPEKIILNKVYSVPGDTVTTGSLRGFAKIKKNLGLVRDKFLFIFAKRFHTKTYFVEAFSSPKRRVLTIAFILSALLIVSIILGIGRRRSQTVSSEMELRLQNITAQIEEAEALSGLNNLRSKTLFTESETTLLMFKDKFKKGSKDRIRIEELLERAQSGLASISKIYRIENPNIFIDLTVIKEGGEAKNFALYQNKLTVVDTKNTSIITVNIDNLATAIVGGGNKTPQPTFVGIHGNNIFVLTSEGLVKIDTATKTQATIVSDLSEVGQAIDMVGFAGNVYILDGENRKIWKFMALEKGYSQARPYLPKDESIPENARSMAIDGSVWVLGGDYVRKYTKGREEAFSLQGLDIPLNTPTVIFTNDESEYIYILDKGGNRVVVFDKEGVYNSQYVWSGISGVSDMVVSEKAKKILLLSGSTIYSIDLKE